MIATIRAFHNCIVGHAGVNRIEAAVRQAHAEGQLSKLPINLRQNICWFKRHCPECQKLEFAKVAAKGPVNSLHVTQIGEEMSVDVIGPLPKTTNGYDEYIIVAIDGFSRNMFAQPAKSTSPSLMAVPPCTSACAPSSPRAGTRASSTAPPGIESTRCSPPPTHSPPRRTRHAPRTRP